MLHVKQNVKLHIHLVLTVDPCFSKNSEAIKQRKTIPKYLHKQIPPTASVLFTIRWGKCPIKCKMQHMQSCNLETFHDNLLQIALDSSPQQWKAGPLVVCTVLEPQTEAEVTSKMTWIKSLQLCSTSWPHPRDVSQRGTLPCPVPLWDSHPQAGSQAAPCSLPLPQGHLGMGPASDTEKHEEPLQSQLSVAPYMPQVTASS